VLGLLASAPTVCRILDKVTGTRFGACWATVSWSGCGRDDRDHAFEEGERGADVQTTTLGSIR